MRSALLFLLLSFFFAASIQSTGSASFPRGQSVTSSNQTGDVSQKMTRRLVNLVQLRAEADELAKMADAIPAEIDQVGKCELPADLSSNLKKIEKLSKRIRIQAMPN